MVYQDKPQLKILTNAPNPSGQLKIKGDFMVAAPMKADEDGRRSLGIDFPNYSATWQRIIAPLVIESIMMSFIVPNG